jgi:predicted negative regulator of RcsB-dependent stress response
MAAMIVEIMLARRGLVLTGAWQGVMRGGGTQVHAALAWWAITGAAFVASFLIAMTTSRFTWLYFRSLRWAAAAALVMALATIGDAIPLAEAAAAGHHALATLTALFVAMLMAGFGAFFAVRQ